MISIKSSSRPLRFTFAGVGWIGLNRLRSLVSGDNAVVVGVAEPDEAAQQRLLEEFDVPFVGSTFEELLDLEQDGIVIATPSRMHALQSISALKRGIPVFCQKPLGISALEVEEVIRTAHDKDCLLGVDFSYRHLTATQMLRELVHSGEIGDVFSVDLVFHNAYGPDKAWYYSKESSGGGCLIDLGVHLVDLLLWVLDFPHVSRVSSNLYRKGRRITELDNSVEDYASVSFLCNQECEARLACSWNLPIAHDASISCTFFGTRGQLILENCDGSFYDFKLMLEKKRSRIQLCAPPDDWGGRAICEWKEKLTKSSNFESDSWNYLTSAHILDLALHHRSVADELQITTTQPIRRESGSTLLNSAVQLRHTGT